MAIPTVWQLILPSFSVTTVIGVLLLLIGIFKGGILNFFGRILSFVTGGAASEGSLRWVFIGGGAVMIWLPSIIKDLTATTEGIVLIIGVVAMLVVLFILFGQMAKKEGGADGF